MTQCDCRLSKYISHPLISIIKRYMPLKVEIITVILLIISEKIALAKLTLFNPLALCVCMYIFHICMIVIFRISVTVWRPYTFRAPLRQKTH